MFVISEWATVNATDSAVQALATSVVNNQQTAFTRDALASQNSVTLTPGISDSGNQTDLQTVAGAANASDFEHDYIIVMRRTADAAAQADRNLETSTTDAQVLKFAKQMYKQDKEDYLTARTLLTEFDAGTLGSGSGSSGSGSSGSGSSGSGSTGTGSTGTGSSGSGSSSSGSSGSGSSSSGSSGSSGSSST